MSVEAQALFLAIAFAAFVLAACNAPIPRVNLVAAGLAAWVLIPLWIALKAL